MKITDLIYKLVDAFARRDHPFLAFAALILFVVAAVAVVLIAALVAPKASVVTVASAAIVRRVLR